MEKIDKILIVMLVFSLVLVCIVMGHTYIRYRASYDTFRTELEDLGIDVETGLVESPSLIKPCNKTMFLYHIDRLNTIVYTDGDYFYVFEPNFEIAYRYICPVIWW